MNTQQKIEALHKLLEEPVPKNTSFSEIHKKIEKIMGRAVWTHEMAFPEMLYNELKQKTKGSAFAKSLQEIAKTKPVMIYQPANLIKQIKKLETKT